MRIDLHYGPQQTTESDRNSQSSQAANSASNQAEVGQDQTRFSGALRPSASFGSPSGSASGSPARQGRRYQASYPKRPVSGGPATDSRRTVHPNGP